MSHYNGVHPRGFYHIIDRGGESAEGLSGRLRPEDKLVRLAEELLDRALEVVPCREVGYAAPVMLLQSIGGPYRNPERCGDYLRGLDRLWLSAGPDHVGTEAAKPGRQQLGPAASALAESPVRGRLVGSISGFE